MTGRHLLWLEDRLLGMARTIPRRMMTLYVAASVVVGSLFWAWWTLHVTNDYHALAPEDWMWMIPTGIAVFAVGGFLLYRAFERQGRLS